MISFPYLHLRLQICQLGLSLAVCCHLITILCYLMLTSLVPFHAQLIQLIAPQFAVKKIGRANAV